MAPLRNSRGQFISSLSLYAVGEIVLFQLPPMFTANSSWGLGKIIYVDTSDTSLPWLIRRLEDTFVVDDLGRPVSLEWPVSTARDFWTSTDQIQKYEYQINEVPCLKTTND